jgi:hypothetical protein
VALLALLTACSDDPAGKGGGAPPAEGEGEPEDDTAPDGGDTGDTIDELPAPGEPWLRDERAAPGSITWSELLYNQPGDGDLEWFELHNPMAMDVDLSGWSVSGGVSYAFEEGVTLPAGGYLVVTADPAHLSAETGYSSALGPYSGRLSNDGERLELWNNSGRLIDTVAYGEDDPWPVAPDGSGLSLAKADPDAASDHAENWTASAELGGTPGQANGLDPHAAPTTLSLIDLEAEWAYDLSGAYPSPDWAQADYDDSAWDRAPAVFFAGASDEALLGTLAATADNYFAVYLGAADGTDLRLVGEDQDGDWTTVERFDVEVGPEDHLFLAAWEASWDYGGPQMTLAEVTLPDDVIGTDQAGFEWILGPTGGAPGIPPADPPPTEAELALLIADADAAGDWAAPAVEADRASSPWGWAVSRWFTDATKYVWPDTFSDTSITNTRDTYALFRSDEPLQGARGSTELSAVPTTATFRTAFTLDADPAATTLSLSCLLDDGAIVYLNGVEVHRENLPAGPLTATTLAGTPIEVVSTVAAELSTASLLRGANVLAVELHQAEPADLDLTFGCALSARVTAETPLPPVLFNEVSPAAASPTAEAPAWVELIGRSETPVALGGLILTASTGAERVLSDGELALGELHTEGDLGFPVEAGDVLFLYSADRSALLDAVRVGASLRGREPEGGPWRFPVAATPGADNELERFDDIVINELQYHAAPVSREGEPVTARPEEWIELTNRGAAEVDLSGWQLVDAVAYTFPDGTTLSPGELLVIAKDAAALRSAHPDITVLGDFKGQLNNSGDRVLLLDARGNPADTVRYYDGGRWPDAADGGGSTLELKDPRADNAAPEAWAASAEGGRAEWVTVSYRGEATPSVVGPDGVWQELVLGLLDQGEVLIDDLRVIQDPDTAPVDLIQNGGFDDGSDGGAAHWRLLGNHRHSEVIADPDDASNAVLRLRASGPTGHMHNHAETTLLRPITTTEYEISYRARWVSGSNQVHSRLYFNRLPHTALVEQPEASGSPGAANSTRIDNLGPTFSGAGQDIAVPAAFEPVRITATAADPDGVTGLTLWSAVDGAAFEPTDMVESAPGEWVAALDGQAAGAITQFYIEAEDSLGALSTFPAAGPDSRALLQADDGLAESNGLHNFRILMTEADSDWLLDDVNLMSDDLIGATIVYDEAEVFYDVGVRAKGSERGRPEVPRLGYGVSFHKEQPFRGSHTSVLVDRSEGVGFGQREVLMNLVMTHAGSVSGEYNDLIHALTPRAEHTGPAELQLDRFSDLVLDAQFEAGSSGTLFEYELIYYPYTTDDGSAEGLKLPQPDAVVGTAITDLGDDKEDWRWNFLIQNNEREDDYARFIDLGQTFALSDADLLAEVEAVIDVDQWLRAYAFATLSGAVDNYGGDGSQHNARFYVRPEDQRLLYFPHDLDFYGGYTMPVVGNGDLRRLLEAPVYRRAYYGHLNDIIGRAYNREYLAPWCEQLGALLPSQDVSGNCDFIANRADWILYGATDSVSAVYPAVSFAITTAGGADHSVASTEVVLEGQGWIDVRSIALDSDGLPLELTWADGTHWAMTVPLEPGANALTLVATDHQGAIVGTDTIVVTSTAGE